MHESKDVWKQVIAYQGYPRTRSSRASGHAGTRSAKTNPSRSTTTPGTAGTGVENMGPAVTQVWNSPRSPQGSAAGGRSASRAASNAPAGEARPAPPRIDARQARFEAAGDHLARERRCGPVPQREERREPGRGEALFAIAPDILEKQIAEGDVSEPVGDGGAACGGHALLVHLVRARRRDRDDDERQAGGLGLRAQRARTARRASRRDRRPR